MTCTVGVVGLGLLGGSLARALAERGARVLGHDRDRDALEAATRAGVLQGTLGADLAGAREVDLLFLAVPVDAREALLGAAAPHLGSGARVTDLGSTQRSGVEAALRLGLGERFVGSHPLAGDHRAGWSASRADLFSGSTVYLCPTPVTAPAVLELFEALWRSLGARPRRVDAAEHDRRLAWSSHLPQLASTALALALGRAGLSPEELGPGGRDATRLAGSSPEMWRAVCGDNAEHLEPALRALEARLAEIREALRDGPAMETLLREGRAWRG